MGFAMCIAFICLAVYKVSSLPIAHEYIFDETKNFTSDCSLHPNLTVKHDKNSGTVSCSFFFEETPPPGVEFELKALVGNVTQSPPFDCSDGNKCYAESKVERIVNCSLQFFGLDGNYMSCFNYSFFVGKLKNTSPEQVQDWIWVPIVSGIFTILAVIVLGFVFKFQVKKIDQNEIKCRAELKQNFDNELKNLKQDFDQQLQDLNVRLTTTLEKERDYQRDIQLKVEQKIEDLKKQYKKDQDDLRIKYEAAKQSPPLTRTGFHSASVPFKLSEEGTTGKAYFSGLRVAKGWFGRQSRKESGAHSCGPALSRDQETHSAKESDESSSVPSRARTANFSVGIAEHSESDSETQL